MKKKSEVSTKRKLLAFLACVGGLISLLTLPAAANVYNGTRYVNGCSQITYWEQNYGGGWGYGLDTDAPSCPSQTISFYQLTDPANGHNTIYWNYSNWDLYGNVKVYIPNGAFMLFNDFNFLRSDGSSIGYRLRTLFCPAGSWPPYC